MARLNFTPPGFETICLMMNRIKEKMLNFTPPGFETARTSRIFRTDAC
ncbi:hypothetical protein [Campylobacter rectus]|nr:hypothetical protein [Campylobacter rectus]